MIEPIKPEEVTHIIPDVVFEVFNELIQKNFNGKSAVVYQDEALNLITARSTLQRSDIFNGNYFDIEPYYRKVGWQVKYRKPGWGEEFKTYFEFRV